MSSSPKVSKKAPPKRKDEPKQKKEQAEKVEKAEKENNTKAKEKDIVEEDIEQMNFKPENQAQMVIAAIKQYQLEVYAKVLDLGDDPDYSNLVKCMTLIRENPHPAIQTCSILLLTGGETHVAAHAYSTKISTKEWIQASFESIPYSSISDQGDNMVRIETTSDAPPIKAKETALANNFNYLRKIGAMPKDDDEDEGFVDYAEML